MEAGDDMPADFLLNARNNMSNDLQMSSSRYALNCRETALVNEYRMFTFQFGQYDLMRTKIGGKGRDNIEKQLGFMKDLTNFTERLIHEVNIL